MPLPLPDTGLLQAALIGLQDKLDDLNRRIAELKAELDSSSQKSASRSPSTGKAKRKRRPMSAAARKRMAAAQRLRWKEYRQAMKS